MNYRLVAGAVEAGLLRRAVGDGAEEQLVAFAQIGDANASIPTTQPLIMRPMFAATEAGTSILFVNEASITNGDVFSYGLDKRIEAVRKCRGIGKANMKLNDAAPIACNAGRSFTARLLSAFVTRTARCRIELAADQFLNERERAERARVPEPRLRSDRTNR